MRTADWWINVASETKWRV